LLVAPSAVAMSGIIQGGVLAFLLTQQHVEIGRSSRLVALLALPTMLYFLWSPITDFFVRRRTWLLMGAVTGGAMMAAGLLQRNLASGAAFAFLLAGGVCTQLVVSSCGGMMGALGLERSKRVASGFYQAGGMGFGAVTLWGLLKVSEKGDVKLLALAAAAMIAIPGLFALAAPKQPLITGDNFGATMERLWGEAKATFGRWEAIPYTLMMLFPMGSGAAVGLLPAVAEKYGVSAGQIGWMNGLAGALLSAAGALAVPLIPARIRASVSYLTVCLVNALTLCLLWLGPLTPATYFVGATLYLFTIGACYALFTAVVLEFLGASGKSGSGRYSIINSLGNVPVLYMTALDGWGASRGGPRWLAGTETVVGGIGGSLLLAYFLLRGVKRGPAGE
jgi:PAT family beta-lactamase induction signal transducer AmpG